VANKIIIKNKSNNQSGSIKPGTSDLSNGEIALNYHADISKIYFKDSASAIREVLDSTGVSEEATALSIALG
jgi:hypothetical protein